MDLRQLVLHSCKMMEWTFPGVTWGSRSQMEHARSCATHGPKCSSAVEGAKMYSGRRGRHTTNLLDILKVDMKHREMNLRNINDLELLRSTAADKARWREKAKKD